MRIGGVFSVYFEESPLFLEQSLKSILRNQTKVLDECVGVIEGDVGEELMKVCNSFPEVTWLKMEEFDGFGLPRALNIAVGAIDTEVILKIDTDDIYSPMRVESTYTAFSSNKRLDIHGGQIQEFSSDFKINYGYRSVPTGNFEIEKFSKKRNPFNGPTVAFRKDAFVRLGGFPQIEANEDYCLWGSFIVNNFIASNSPEVYAFMRGGQELISRRSTNNYRNGEVQSLVYLKNIGLFTNLEFLRHFLVKQIIRRLPISCISYIYSRFRINRKERIPQGLQTLLKNFQDE